LSKASSFESVSLNSTPSSKGKERDGAGRKEEEKKEPAKTNPIPAF
jgi:hypothetical protein